MIDFGRLTEEELVGFVDSNFIEFAAERDDAFPANVLGDLASGACVLIKRSEGFAIAYKGRRYTTSPGGIEADLMFLFVDPAHVRRGIGAQLVEQVKAAVTPGLPILLSCEGEERNKFFEHCGFRTQEYFEDIDTYSMTWVPNTSIG